MEALGRNASTPADVQSLNSVHDTDNGDLLGFLKGIDTQAGSKILGHVLGNKETSVQSKLAANTGMDVSQVAGLMDQFAPLVLAFLGNQKKQTNTSANGLSGLTSGLGAMLGGSGSHDLLGMASKFLDDDGDVTDDPSKMLGDSCRSKLTNLL